MAYPTNLRLFYLKTHTGAWTWIFLCHLASICGYNFSFCFSSTISLQKHLWLFWNTWSAPAASFSSRPVCRLISWFRNDQSTSHSNLLMFLSTEQQYSFVVRPVWANNVTIAWQTQHGALALFSVYRLRIVAERALSTTVCEEKTGGVGFKVWYRAETDWHVQTKPDRSSLCQAK